MIAELEHASATGDRTSLEIRTIYNNEKWNGIDRLEAGADESGVSVRLLEESEYEFRMASAERVDRLEPSEMFSASSEDLTTGRIKTRGRTGIVRVDAYLSTGEVLSGEIEVRSRKLNYRTEYRWMLERIAAEATALALSPFAASRLSSLVDDHSGSAETLYQRFEFLRAQLDSEELAGAIGLLRRRPHTSFEDEAETTSTNRPLRGGAALARQLARPGSRRSLPEPVGRLTSVPLTVDRRVHIESFDTVPNRFVRYVVEEWTGLVDAVGNALGTAGEGSGLPSQERGVREVAAVRQRLEELLRIPALRDAGRLDAMPGSNTVVRGRPGYREFLAAFQTSTAHAHLCWDQREDLRSAGQHDVATLYEYWVFLELVRLVETLPGFTADRSELFEITDNSLMLRLQRADETRVRCWGERRGQEIELGIWFNRSFTHDQGARESGSWTVGMRPDVSISIERRSPSAGRGNVTWVHFDAKYKVKDYTTGFADPDVENERTGRVVPADVQKMHAYRDAIRRSAGAYVIYPGSRDLSRQQYHELLPGLGAFCLRPEVGGEASSESTSNVRRFLLNVIDHLAAGGTNLERDRHWTDLINASTPVKSERRGFLNLPPADTSVLAGFVRSSAHWNAIRKLGLYNLRADVGRPGSVGVDSALLAADFVILYGRDGDGVVFRTTGRTSLMRSVDLAVEHYEPSGELYLCVGIEPDAVAEFDGAKLRTMVSKTSTTVGEPVQVSWAALEMAMES